MAARKKQSEKNATAKARFNEKSSNTIRSTIDRVNKEYTRQEIGAAKARTGERSAGNDLYLGTDREAPIGVYSPKKSDFVTDSEGNRTGEYKGVKLASMVSQAGLDIAGGGVAAADTDAANQAVKEQSKQATQEWLAQAEKDTKSNPWLHGLAQLGQAANQTPLGDLWQDISQDQGKEQAPKNTAQWLLNALSTGTYVTARQGENAGRTFDETIGQAEDGDLGGAIGTATKGLLVDGVGSAMRGIAEGLGNRFEGEKPRTWGQNLEAVGSRDAIAGIVGEEKADFTQGVVGTVADIGLDPATYLTLGATAGIKAGGRAAAAASGAAREAGSGALGRVVRGAAAAPGAAIRGAIDESAVRAAARAAARENRNLRRADQAAPTEVIDDAVEVADEADEVLPAAGTSTPATPAAAIEVPEDAAALLAPQKLTTPDPRMAAAESVLASITRTGEPTPAVSVKSILDSARVAATGGVDETTAATLRDVVSAAPVAEGRATLTALRETPEGAEVLARPIDYNGSQIPLEKMVQIARTARVTGQKNAGALAKTVEDALRGTGEAGFDRARFVDAVRGAGQNVDVDDLFIRIQAAKTDRGRLQILRNALRGGDGTATPVFGTVDDFLDSAVAGDVPVEQMQAMLKALSIRTSANAREPRLRELLDSRGRTEWAKVQESLRTPQEIVSDHALPQSVVETAARVDVDAEQEAAADAAQGLDSVIREFDDEIRPQLEELQPGRINPVGTSGSSLGEAVHEAVLELGRQVAKKATDGDTSEILNTKGTGQIVKIHSAIIRPLSYWAKTVSGADRAAFIGPRYLAATRYVEAYSRSLGLVARADSSTGKGAPLYASVGDLAHALGDDVFSRAMFTPVYGRTGFTDEVSQGFKRGFTIYPNHMLESARFSITARDQGLEGTALADAIYGRFLSNKGPNLYGSTKEGKATYRELANAMAGDEFQSAIRAINQQNQVRAAAFANAEADRVVQPLAERLVAALAKGADRGEIAGLIKAISRDAAAATKNLGGEGDTLVHDLVRGRLDQGVVNGILGIDGAITLKMDGRIADLGGPVAGRQGRQEAANAARAGSGDGVGSTPGRPVSGAAEAEYREGVAAALQTTLRDSDQLVDEQVAEAAAKTDIELEDTEELAALMTRLGLQEGMLGVTRSLDRIGTGGYGAYGMGTEFRAIAANGETVGRLASNEFTVSMQGWISGRKGRPSLATRIAEVRRGEGSPDVSATVKDWWRQLAAVPRGLADDQARALLVRGARATADTPQIRAVSEAEADLMLELRTYIGKVFNEDGTGMFARAGVTAREVARQQKMFGFNGRLGGYGVNPDVPLADQAAIWRTFEFDENTDALTLLSNYSDAISAAAAKPRVAALIAHNYSSPKGTPDAMRINTQKDPDSLAAYLPKDAYFTPEVRRQMSYLDAFMKASRTFDSQAMRNIAVYYDGMTRIMKSVATVWRVGHHVTNILGEFASNLMAGVSPAQAIRGWRVTVDDLKARGELGDDVLAQFDDMLGRTEVGAVTGERATTGARGPRSTSNDVRVVLGGSKEVRTLSSADIVNAARQYGIYMTHTSARDILEPVGATINPSGIRKVTQKLGKPDELLGRFSAFRDNGTRMAHFMVALERGRFANLEEAFTKAAAEVNAYHPSLNGLSTFESKYARRVIYFYTWVKQIAGTVLRDALDRPGFITMPSKFQYNQAEAAGLDPESIGDPFSAENEERMPSYLTNGLLGPTMTAGNSPTDAGENLWGFSMSTPQIDGLMALFGGFSPSLGDPGYTQPAAQVAGGVNEAVLANLNPILKAPYELGSLTKIEDSLKPDAEARRPVGSTKATDETRRAQWLLDSLGGSATGLLKSTGQYGEMFPRSDYGLSDEELAKVRKGEQQTALVNWLTGMKFTNYTSPGNLLSGEFENKKIATKLAE